MRTTASMRALGLRRHLFLCLALCVLAAAPGAHADNALKDEAIARLVGSHDPAIAVGVGRVYVKQAGLLELRRLLAAAGAAAAAGPGWRAGAAQWQAAERALIPLIDLHIAREVENTDWFRRAWGSAAAQVLDAEEADEIATHFASEGGGRQRAVIELLLVGETLLANYTFTGRIRYDVAGAEREMSLLQKAWWVEDHRRVYDFTHYPSAMRFASQDPGVKYSKMLAIQGIDAINRHFQRVVADVEGDLRRHAADISPYVERFKAGQQGQAPTGYESR